jgi:hypothetical protein
MPGVGGSSALQPTLLPPRMAHPTSLLSFQGWDPLISSEPGVRGLFSHLDTNDTWRRVRRGLAPAFASASVRCARANPSAVSAAPRRPPVARQGGSC